MSQQTGSLVNLISGNAKYPEPEVGMGATILGWTDRNPATIVAVRTNKDGKAIEVQVQEDNYKRVDANGMSEMQDYEYTPNPEAPIRRYSLRNNGAWVRVGETAKGGQRLAIGRREKYHDFSF